MNKKYLVLITLSASLTLFGCSFFGVSTDSNETKAVDSNQIETDTYVEPTVEVVVEPSRSANTCSVTSQTSLVANFASDIPIYPGSVQFSASCEDETSYALRHRSTDSPEKVTSYMLEQIKKLGWTLKSNENRLEDYEESYNYYQLINAERAGGSYGRTLIFDIRDERYNEGYTEIIVRERYGN